MVHTREQGRRLACFDASGDLQSANEEMGADEGRGRRTRGEASYGGGARTKASWWRCHHVRQSRSRARAVGHEIGFRAQRSDHPYNILQNDNTCIAAIDYLSSRNNSEKILQIVEK